MAAAIGVRLPVQDPAGNMSHRYRRRRTEVALISLSRELFSAEACVAGDEPDEAIVQSMKRFNNGE